MTCLLSCLSLSYVISFYFREIRRVDNDQEIISLFPYFQVILFGFTIWAWAHENHHLVDGQLARDTGRLAKFVRALLAF